MKIITAITRLKGVEGIIFWCMMYNAIFTAGVIALAPIITATKGTYMLPWMISAYIVVAGLGSMLSVYFEETSVKRMGQWLMLFEVLNILSMFLAFYDKEIWLWVSLAIWLGRSPFNTQWDIRWHVIASTQGTSYSEIQQAEKVIKSSIKIFFGFVMTAVLFFGEDYGVMVSIFMRLLSVSSLIVIYFRYWK